MYAGADLHEDIRRMAHFINTSSIGAGATISSSTFKAEFPAATTDCDVGTTANDAAGYILVNSKQATGSIPVAGDFEQFGDTIDLERAEQLGPEINFLGATTGGKFVVFYSTTTYTQYISLTGTTTLGLVVRGDQSDSNANTFGCNNNSVGYTFSTSLDTTEANRPILLVAYTGAAVAVLPRRPGIIWFSEE